jgi:hypothetical protein
MDVHKILFECKKNDSRVVDYELGTFDHTLLWVGQSFPKDALHGVTLKVSRRSTNPDLLDNPLSWFICSEKMSRFIQSHASEHVQRLDCKIEDEKGQPFEGYQVLNVLTLIEALDLERSECVFESGSIDRIRAWAFRWEKIPCGQALFRKKHYPYAVFATGLLAQAFPPMTGFLFERCTVL